MGFDFGVSKTVLQNALGILSQAAGISDSQVFSNKDFDVALNNLIRTTPSLGSILVDNGTKFVARSRGSANLPLKVKSDGSDIEYAKLDVAGGGTGQTSLTSGAVLIGAGTSGITTKTNPAGAFMGLSDVQTNTGLKIFLDTTLGLRNPSGTNTLTFHAPDISADIDYRFYEPYRYLLVNEGTTIYAKNGITAGIDYSGSNTTAAAVTTVIQNAIDHLTAGRTYKERVKLRGTFPITTLSIPSYCCLDLTDAVLTQANSTNLNMFINSDTSGGNTQIEVVGGNIDGNKAGQSLDSIPYNTRNAFNFTKVTDSSIHNSYIANANSSAVYLKDCTNVVVSQNSLVTPRKLGIFSDSSSLGASSFIWANNNYIANCSENFISSQGTTDMMMADNLCNTSGTTGINLNGDRNFVINNIVKGATFTGIATAIEGTYTSHDSQILGNIVTECKTGGISCGTANLNHRLQIIGNKVKGATSGAATSARGLRLLHSQNSVVSGNLVWNWQSAGMTIEGYSGTIGGASRVAKKNIITDNIIWDNGQYTSAGAHDRVGISLFGSVANGVNADHTISNNTVYDGGAGTQLYGIRYVDTDNLVIQHNDLRNNITTGIQVGTGNLTTLVRRNLGYVTENSGSSSQSGNASTKVFNIAHGLAAVPTKYIVQPGSADAVGPPYLTADATNLIVTFPTAPPTGTSNLVFRWLAEVI